MNGTEIRTALFHLERHFIVLKRDIENYQRVDFSLVEKIHAIQKELSTIFGEGFLVEGIRHRLSIFEGEASLGYIQKNGNIYNIDEIIEINGIKFYKSGNTVLYY